VLQLRLRLFLLLQRFNTSQFGTLPTLPLLALFVLALYSRTKLAGIAPLLGMVRHVVEFTICNLSYFIRNGATLVYLFCLSADGD
jgi:hypothetical protein